jgi:hypothetical protein
MIVERDFLFYLQLGVGRRKKNLYFSFLAFYDWKYIFSDNILPNDGQDNASQIEEAYMLVEKLMAENAELVEKVNMQGS